MSKETKTPSPETHTVGAADFAKLYSHPLAKQFHEAIQTVDNLGCDSTSAVDQLKALAKAVEMEINRLSTTTDGDVTDDMLNEGQERMCQMLSRTVFEDHVQAEVYKSMRAVDPAFRSVPLLDELENTLGKNVGMIVARMTTEMRQRYREALGPSPQTNLVGNDAPQWQLDDARIKRLMEQCGMLNSMSVYQAMKQLVMETELSVRQQLGSDPARQDAIPQMLKALEKIASLTQTEGLLWWQIEARNAIALSTGVSPAPQPRGAAS